MRADGAGDRGGIGLCEILLDEGVDVGFRGGAGVVVEVRFGRFPFHLSPSSPGVNITTEQNPSVEVMSKVSPSGDLGIVSAY